MSESGASLPEIADILGHKQISVTKRYAHLCIEHKSSLINRVMGKIQVDKFWYTVVQNDLKDMENSNVS